MTNATSFGREICGDLEQSLRREWLITNGLGGFGSGTVGGCQTRRYHGLLIAAEKPPVGRTVYLVDLDATARVDGRHYELACHEYESGLINPHGHELIESFGLEGTVPNWVYALGSARLRKRIFMARDRNTTYVTYTLERSLAPVTLTVRPLCTGRDYHGQRRGRDGYASQAIAGGCRISPTGAEANMTLTVDAGEFVAAPDMHWNLRHRREAERGLDSIEDLYMPGVFECTLSQGDRVHFTATTETGAQTADVAFNTHLRYESGLLAQVNANQPRWIRQLVLAADQYIVARHGSVNGKTIIAGYPWFGDWGRDTMIALPGLTLATGRTEIAVDILRTFAKYLNQGLLPNRFPDSGEAPEYNTVDATLWYFVAIHEYLRVTTDIAFAREIYPVLDEIIRWHRAGTLHGIGVDPADGLLRAGAPGLQLTWMDAKVAQWVVTPRTGKAVEVNALWCNALWIMAQLAEQIGNSPDARRYDDAAHATAQVFGNRFWFDDGQYLYDVVDAPAGASRDPSLRPNQLIALSLPYRILDDVRARMVLRTCERELLTSYGLRTLDPDDPQYVGHYCGDQRRRDGAYHQGTVWPWLLGAFARSHFNLYGNVVWAASYLAPLEQHLADAGIGQISEIFDADAPHMPQGCVAQAWSVAEVLRAWLEIHAVATLATSVESTSLDRKVS